MSSDENQAMLAKFAQTPSHLEWIRVEELGYTDSSAAPPETSERRCFGCGAIHAKLLRCGQCRVASYCQKDCQVHDWKQQHKKACATYKRVGPDMCLSTAADQAAVRSDIFHRIRFYICAFAAYKERTLGRGFLFIQADQSLVALSLALPMDAYGRPLPTRAVLVHYLTLGEYDAEVCREDFEMATVRSELQTAVDAYDEQTEVVLLMRFRCGSLAVGKAQLAMPYGSFRKLGVDLYAEQDMASLQLNIDDM